GGADGLGEAEEEGHVAVDAILLQDAGGLDAFPGGGELDEDALASDAVFGVGVDEEAAFGDEGVRVKGKFGAGFGGDAMGHGFEDLEAEINEDQTQRVGSGEAGLPGVGDGFGDDGFIFRVGGGFENEAGIGGGVLGGEFLEVAEVSGVGDDAGETAE